MTFKNLPTPAQEPAEPVEDGFLSGDAEINALIRSCDWSITPLGPIAFWPQSLRTTISLCLASNFPINIIWGSSHTQIYNGGFRAICSDKHPAALGMDFPECWTSAWPIIGPPFERALKGDVSFLENQRMFVFRNGFLEETFFTFSFSPIRDESGGIGGIFAPVTETTATMIGERRTRVIRDLTASLGYASSTAEVFKTTVTTLSGFDLDLPFVLLYALDGKSHAYHLSSATGVAPGSAISPVLLHPDGSTIWPMARLLDHTTLLTEVDGVQAQIGSTPCGPYEEAPNLAFCLAVRQPGIDTPVALLMLGASARLPMNDVYSGLYDLIAAAFNAALTRVTAAEKERNRLDALAALDRAKTDFFTNVSHEFRTPMTLMLGPLEEALATEGLPAALQERLQIANRNALRMLKLVDSLLDFSRIQAGRNDASFMATDLSALTLELASNFQSACMQAGLGFTVACSPLRESVHVDRTMWEKIVLNLLSNAFKFTLQGGIEVFLREQGDGVELEIGDTGIGIPAVDLPHVFTRFYRGEGQRGRSMEGTGIGLSLVQELVHLHGGMISVNSTPGQGSLFKVTVPFGTSHLPDEQLHARPTPLVHSARGAGYAEEATQWISGDAGSAGQSQVAALPGAPDRPRIILADDNADMRAYIQRILEEGGYHVEAVSNGAVALSAVKNGPLPDLILSDVMMPEIDGFSLLQTLRSETSTEALVVILLSARAGEEARLEGLAAGADDYLVKPFSARELRARVDGAIALARQRRMSVAREQTLLTAIDAERSRAALQKSQAHFALLFEQTAAGIAEADINGFFVRANGRFCQIVGRTLDEVIGTHHSALVHPEDWLENLRLFTGTVNAGMPFEVENRYLRPDGTAVWVSKTVNPIHDFSGKAVISTMAVVLDITQRKQAQEELSAVSRRKDEFLAMLAHELRNPLAPISAAAELIGMGPFNEARLKKVSAVITRQVRHMTGLVDDLLDVSRVDRGLVTINKSTHDLKNIVSNALEQVQPLMQARGHQLLVNFAPEPQQVYADEKRLVQILTNLLNNSAKFTPSGGQIELSTEVHQDCVVLSVRDNGIGIAPGLQTRVFDLFSQAEQTSDRSHGGLGLGLALVKSLVGLHDGKVSCASEGLGMGSVFTVTLPRLNKASDDRANILQKTVTTGQGQHGRLRVLVVDDNIDAAQMLTIVLQDAGHEVLVEHDPFQALELARLNPPAVCLLDIGLPGMNGYELARRLRAQPGMTHCILIAVTGYGQLHDRDDARDAGFDHHLVKPVDLVKLTSLLDKISDAVPRTLHEK